MIQKNQLKYLNEFYNDQNILENEMKTLKIKFYKNVANTTGLVKKEFKKLETYASSLSSLSMNQKISSLNYWYGHSFESYINFLESQANDICTETKTEKIEPTFLMQDIELPKG